MVGTEQNYTEILQNGLDTILQNGCITIKMTIFCRNISVRFLQHGFYTRPLKINHLDEMHAEIFLLSKISAAICMTACHRNNCAGIYWLLMYDFCGILHNLSEIIVIHVYINHLSNICQGTILQKIFFATCKCDFCKHCKTCQKQFSRNYSVIYDFCRNSHSRRNCVLCLLFSRYISFLQKPAKHMRNNSVEHVC